jgi:sugar porter (SP) family MFS transporter
MERFGFVDDWGPFKEDLSLKSGRSNFASVGSWTSVGYNQCYELSSFTVGVLSSLNLIGAMCTTLVCFRYADYLGRRLEVQLASLLYLIGTLVTAVVPMLWATAAGLLVYGFGIGFAVHAAPMYIAEIAPADYRGMLVSAKEGVIVLGMLFGFLAGACFDKTEVYGWRWATALNVVFASIQMIGINFLPDSPRWLVLRYRGDPEKAREALVFFRQSEDVGSELTAIQDETVPASEIASEGSRKSGHDICGAFYYPRPLIIACGLVFLQQATGQPSVLYYATNIFKSAGFASGFAAWSSVVIGVVKLIATLFSVALVDRNGRRFLLFVGIGMMTIALLTISIAMQHRFCSIPGQELVRITPTSCPPEKIRMPHGAAFTLLAALMVFVSGYQVGFGPIAWLMVSEVFPLHVRGSAISVAAIVNFGFNILVTLCQETLMASLQPQGLFLLYFFLALLSLVFVYFIVPETKGKTLEEIGREMDPLRAKQATL